MFRNVVETKFWGYRRARVSEIFLTLERTCATVEEFERWLWDQADCTPCNHSVIGFRNHNDRWIYVWLTDFSIHLGLSIREENE